MKKLGLCLVVMFLMGVSSCTNKATTGNDAIIATEAIVDDTTAILPQDSVMVSDSDSVSVAEIED